MAPGRSARSASSLYRGEVTDDEWGMVRSSITLIPPFDASSLCGLEQFSHIEVIYLFDRVDPSSVCLHARRPRGNPAWPEVGIFAQRAKGPPNRLGLSTCELLAVEDHTIHVRGLDAVDGTPAPDVKPHRQEFGPRGSIRQPAWSTELITDYF
jgi:tRNA-Thr(GGU) m(6)t(6)A37 methyltransferase TsaA